MQADVASTARAAGPEFAHGTRDLCEMLYVCDVLAGQHDAQLRDILPRLLSGAGTPDHEASSAARNIQFEAVLGAQFVASGFPVTFAEPDFIFELGGVRYGMAAKRTGSAKMLAQRVAEGAKQLARLGLSGFVAVNLDGLAQRADTYLYVREPDPALAIAATTRLADLLKEHGPAMHAEAQRVPNVVGVCVSATVVGFVRVPWQPAFSTAQYWLEETPRLGPVLTERLPEPVLRD
jgi:hypothetical protein